MKTVTIHGKKVSHPVMVLVVGLTPLAVVVATLPALACGHCLLRWAGRKGLVDDKGRINISCESLERRPEPKKDA